ncbi:hypothetical protein [Cryobacterium tagatosivorans]|uniref:GNAT family N-acetyltransferase n=1 Tax=Cryobacterium tagatosivorans TaxID=1259199 RepID=A0A4R8UGQ2_9MICO|nr:hypothetical protein [Cryobacterium tagatosivorans]TFB52823.1 hypothetical protein E3O23_05865 [Cryobacterium tagatosivorans]
MTTDLRLIGSLDAATRDRVTAALGHLDFPVGQMRTGEALVRSYLHRAPDRSWALFQGDEAVGVFAVVPYLELPGTYQTSTYLTLAARGTGLNSSLKRAVVLASRAESLPLYSSIHHANARSLAATRKLFVSVEPTIVFERVAGRVAWRFELSVQRTQLAAGPVDSYIVALLGTAMRQPALQAA